MRQDDITNYTNDKAILEMHDFTNESADGDSTGYMAAQVEIAERIHCALRIARWAKTYRGVELDRHDIETFKKMLDDI